MIKYKVFPTNGAYKAPCIYVEAQNEVEAETKAKEHSGLSRFSEWLFIVKK